MAEKKYDRYLVITGQEVTAVVVGPFPEGFYALMEFPLPAGYDSATSHPTREEAEAEAEWYREHLRK